MDSIHSVTTSTPMSSLHSQQVGDLVRARLVPVPGRLPDAARPAPVAVEDDADVARQSVLRERRRQPALVQPVERVGQAHAHSLVQATGTRSPYSPGAPGGPGLPPAGRPRTGRSQVSPRSRSRGRFGGVTEGAVDRVTSPATRSTPYLRCRNLRCRRFPLTNRVRSMSSSPAPAPGQPGAQSPQPPPQAVGQRARRAGRPGRRDRQAAPAGLDPRGRHPVRARRVDRPGRPLADAARQVVHAPSSALTAVMLFGTSAVYHRGHWSPKVAGGPAPARPHQHLPHHRRHLHAAVGAAAARRHRPRRC